MCTSGLIPFVLVQSKSFPIDMPTALALTFWLPLAFLLDCLIRRTRVVSDAAIMVRRTYRTLYGLLIASGAFCLSTYVLIEWDLFPLSAIGQVSKAFAALRYVAIALPGLDALEVTGNPVLTAFVRAYLVLSSLLYVIGLFFFGLLLRATSVEYLKWVALMGATALRTTPIGKAWIRSSYGPPPRWFLRFSLVFSGAMILLLTYEVWKFEDLWIFAPIILVLVAILSFATARALGDLRFFYG